MGQPVSAEIYDIGHASRGFAEKMDTVDDEEFFPVRVGFFQISVNVVYLCPRRVFHSDTVEIKLDRGDVLELGDLRPLIVIHPICPVVVPEKRAGRFRHGQGR